jgi:transcriptional regulator with XRE-family HTH domain
LTQELLAFQELLKFLTVDPGYRYHMKSGRENTMSKVSEIDQTASNEVVGEPSVESLIREKNIGARLRHLRLKRSMGLVELGQRAGLSPSFLSQLETGRVIPTLRNLARIAMVHNIEMSSLFSAPKKNVFRISKAKDRVSIPSGPKDRPFMLSQSMSALISDRTLVPCIAELRPGFDKEAFEAKPLQGVELAYVMQGSVSVTDPRHSGVLEEGDLIWIDGMVKRRYKCVSNIPAKVLIISFPFGAAAS